MRSAFWVGPGSDVGVADLEPGEAIDGAFYPRAGAFEDVGVDHGRADIAVAEQFLNRADVDARLEEVGGERVAEAVAPGLLGDAGF